MPSPCADTNHQFNKAVDPSQDAADEAARTDRTVTDEAARVSADIANRGNEAARNTMEAGRNTATQSVQRVTDQFTKVLGFNGPQAQELARRLSENVQAVTQARAVQDRGTQGNPHDMFALVQDRLTKDIEAVNRILSSRLVQDFVADQSDPVRHRLQEMIDANRRVGELVIRIAEQMGRIIQAQANQNTNQARWAG